VSTGATIGAIQEIIRREGRSFLQYIGDTFPWVADEDRAAFVQLQQIIGEQRQGIGKLMRFLSRQRADVPYLGSYPQSFTSWNFVSVTALVPRLVDDVRRGIDALSRDMARISDPDALTLVASFLTMKRKHLQTLEAMSAHTPRPVAVA
jgi:hypothetical protein